jgi:hypothetical protein
MKPTPVLHESPRYQLLRLETDSSPVVPATRSYHYLKAIGILLLMLAMIAAGIAAAEIFGAYTGLIEKMASPFWR